MDLIEAAEPQEIGACVQALVLTKSIPAYKDPSNVLFVRPCIREICDSIVKDRRTRIAGKAAICGQPGIGKSYALFYLAYRLLKEADVDAIVLENSETKRFYFFVSAGFDRTQFPEEIQDSGVAGIPISESLKETDKLLQDRKIVYMVDMSKNEGSSFPIRTAGYSIFSSSPAPFALHLKPLQQKIDLIIYSPPPWSKEQLKLCMIMMEIYPSSGNRVRTGRSTNISIRSEERCARCRKRMESSYECKMVQPRWKIQQRRLKSWNLYKMGRSILQNLPT
jgi:hypothetical protein